jgi:GNAT superfamily N-acetyltransferase
MSLEIRPATPGDAELVVRWNMLLAEESEDKTLAQPVLAEGVRQVLADQRKGRYFVAMVDGQPVGQTMVTYEWSDWRNGWIWWIQSVYVEPDYRRRGIYRALHDHIADVARRSGEVVGLRLYVEQSNTVAREVYRSCGLRPAGYLVYEHMFGEAGDSG